MTEPIFQTAVRYPKIPTRAEIPVEERSDYDYLQGRVADFQLWPDKVDGVPYGVAHYSAFMISPAVGRIISDLGSAVMKTQGVPGSYSHADHELIDLVLAFDSGYWALVAGHTPHAIASGVRIEALEAIVEGREQDLTEDEAHVIGFIRAVRDGGVTDAIWSAMRERLGSDRGVVDYVFFVLVLLLHHRFCWAVGAPEMTREAWREMIADFRAGRRDAEAIRRDVEKRYADRVATHVAERTSAGG